MNFLNSIYEGLLDFHTVLNERKLIFGVFYLIKMRLSGSGASEFLPFLEGLLHDAIFHATCFVTMILEDVI